MDEWTDEWMDGWNDLGWDKPLSKCCSTSIIKETDETDRTK